MDQTIGIGYQVDGVQGVVAANNQVIGSFEKVVSKIQNVSGVVSALGGSFSALKGSMSGLKSTGGIVDAFRGSSTSISAAAKASDRFNTSIGGTPGRVTTAVGKIRELTSAVTAYSAAVGSIKPIPMAPMTGTGPGKGGGSPGVVPIHDRDILGMMPKWMFMWRLGSEAIQGGQYAINDLLLGRSREKLGTELGQLSPLGFDQDLKSKTEQSAKLFSQKFWTVSAESYVTAMAQTASAFDVSRIGYKNLRQMNEASVQFSMVSKISQEKAADLVQKSILALMTGLPEEVARKLNAGEVAEVKGYGKVNLGGLAEKLSAQLGKTVAVSSIWGPGIQAGFRQALPTLVDKGWDIPSALALIGSYVDVGYQPSQGGRTVKDIFEKEPASMAKALLWGTGNWQSESPQLDAQTLAHNKKVNRIHEEAVVPYVISKLKDPESAMELFGILGQIVQKAEASGVDINQFKFSKYFLPMIRQTLKKPFGERHKYLKEQVDSATPEEAARIAEETLGDAGTAYQRITGAFQNLSTTMADSSWAHRIAKAVSAPMNFLDANLQFIKNTKGLAHDELAAAYLEQEQKYVALFGQSQANLILKNAIAADKGQNVMEGAGFMGSMYQTTNELSSLWDNRFVAPFSLSDDAQQAVSEFWDSNIVQPLKSIDVAWEGYKAEIYAALDAIPQKVREFVGSVSEKVDGLIPKKIEPEPGNVPAPEDTLVTPWYERPALQMMSYGGPGAGANPEITLTSHVDANLNLDGRILARAIAEVIQQNRDVHYHGYGGDPMGFVT